MSGHVLYIDSVAGIPEAQILRDGMEGHSFFYRLHATFFDSLHKIVLGETYEGPLHETEPVETSVYDASMKDFMYFIFDTEISVSLLIEVVLVALDNYNRLAQEVGLGWTLLNLTDASGLRDISSYKKANFFSDITPHELFQGTPRSYLTSSESSHLVLDGAELRCCLFTHRRLDECRSILPLNTIFDEKNGTGNVAGLISPHIQFALQQAFHGDLRRIHAQIAPQALTTASTTLGIGVAEEKRPRSGGSLLRAAATTVMASKAFSSGGKRSKGSKDEDADGTEGKSKKKDTKSAREIKERAEALRKLLKEGWFEELLAERTKLREAFEEKKRKKKESSKKQKKEKARSQKDKRRKKHSKKKHRRSTRDDDSDDETESQQYQSDSDEDQDDDDESAGDSDEDEDRDSDEEDDGSDFDEVADLSSTQIVIPPGKENWLSLEGWTLDDFLPLLPSFGFDSDAAKDQRAHLINALSPYKSIPRGCDVTKRLVLQHPWLFGASLLSPVKQEMMVVKLGEVSVYLKQGFEDLFKAHLNSQRLWEQHHEPDDQTVVITKRYLQVSVHNGAREIFVSPPVEMIVQPKQVSITGKDKKKQLFSVLSAKKPGFVLVKSVIPHPSCSLLFRLMYEIDVPYTTPESVMLDKKAREIVPKVVLQPIVKKEICVGWIDYQPFDWKFKTTPIQSVPRSSFQRDEIDALGDDDDEEDGDDDDEEEDDEEEDGNEGKMGQSQVSSSSPRMASSCAGDEPSEDDPSQMVEGFEEVVLEVSPPPPPPSSSSLRRSPSPNPAGGRRSSRLSSTPKEASGGRSPISESSGPKQIIVHRMKKLTIQRWRKKLMMTMRDLVLPPNLASDKRIKQRSVLYTKLELRREPLLPILYQNTYGFLTYDPTRGLLLGSPSYEKRLPPSRGPSCYPPPPSLSSSLSTSSQIALPSVVSQAKKLVAPQHERVFPFDLLHPYCPVPFDGAGPPQIPAAVPPMDPSIRLHFQLLLPSESDYSLLPVYVEAPFDKKKLL